MELPKRKPIRLSDYDYSSPGAYFVTICTHDRQCILSRVSVGADALGGPNLQLTDTGIVVEQHILSTDHIPGFHVDKYVVMPNHIHMILRIDSEAAAPENGPPRASAPTGWCKKAGVKRRPREGQAPPLRRRTNVGRNQQRDVEDAVPYGMVQISRRGA